MALDWNIWEFEITVRGVSLGRLSNEDRIPVLREYLIKNNIKGWDLLPGDIRYKLVKKEQHGTRN